MIPETLRHLASALEALSGAYKGCDDGFVCDYIQAAEGDIYRALRQIAKGQVDDEPEELPSLDDVRGILSEAV
jgi:hypothetical protein